MANGIALRVENQRRRLAYTLLGIIAASGVTMNLMASKLSQVSGSLELQIAGGLVTVVAISAILVLVGSTPPKSDAHDPLKGPSNGRA